MLKVIKKDPKTSEKLDHITIEQSAMLDISLVRANVFPVGDVVCVSSCILPKKPGELINVISDITVEENRIRQLIHALELYAAEMGV